MPTAACHGYGYGYDSDWGEVMGIAPNAGRLQVRLQDGDLFTLWKSIKKENLQRCIVSNDSDTQAIVLDPVLRRFNIRKSKQEKQKELEVRRKDKELCEQLITRQRLTAGINIRFDGETGQDEGGLWREYLPIALCHLDRKSVV